MSESKIKAGRYKAKLLGYAIQQTQAGDPQLACKFELTDEAVAGDSVFWQGGFKPAKEAGTKGPRDFTFEAMEVLGFDFSKKLSLLADGPTSGALDMNKEVALTIEMEMYQGKPQVRVKWVNDVNGAKFRNAMTKDEFVVKCAGLNLDAAVMAFRQGKPQAAARPQAQDQPAVSLDDIPF